MFGNMNNNKCRKTPPQFTNSFTYSFLIVCVEASTCNNQGICMSDETCWCNNGFSGTSCNTPGKQKIMITSSTHTVILEYFNIKEQALSNFSF